MATRARNGRTAAAKSGRGSYGKLYRGREGQWSWVAHRVTGVVIILFLFAHVVDTAVVGWGPDAYNKVIHVYQNPIVGILEFVLVACVIYHALNGLRIMIIDFWPQAALWHRQLFYGTMGLFVAGMIPIAIIMGNRIAQEILH
jgi:succinate dehydrogenase cytochrome b subunit